MPENQVRCDLLSWHYSLTDSFWGINVSTKLYSNKISSEMKATDIHSTDPNKFYYTVDGKQVNIQEKENRKDYEDLIKKFKIIGFLRLHILLEPDEETNKNNKKDGLKMS